MVRKMASKVPGKVLPIGKYEHEQSKFRHNLPFMDLGELQIHRARISSILTKNGLMARLPDKGQKVRSMYFLIQNLIDGETSGEL